MYKCAKLRYNTYPEMLLPDSAQFRRSIVQQLQTEEQVIQYLSTFCFHHHTIFAQTYFHKQIAGQTNSKTTERKRKIRKMKRAMKKKSAQRENVKIKCNNNNRKQRKFIYVLRARFVSLCVCECIISHQIFKIIVRGEWIFILARAFAPRPFTKTRIYV